MSRASSTSPPRKLLSADNVLSACGCQIGPAQWDLRLTAFLVEEAHFEFTAVVFAGESLKLTTGERVKGMRDPKLLGFYSTNACNATPFLYRWSTRHIRIAPLARASATMSNAGLCRIGVLPVLSFLRSASFCRHNQTEYASTESCPVC